MEYKLVIQGRLACLNDYLSAERITIRTPKGITTKGNILKQKTQDDICEFIYKYLRGVHIDKSVSLHYTFYEPNRKRDKDNIASFGMKVIQDSLVKTKVLENDNWKCIKGFTCDFEVDSKNPRIEIIIKEID